MIKAGFPLANIFARSDFFPLSLSFRLKPSGTNRAQTKEKSRFARKYSLVENRLNRDLKAGFPLANIFARSEFFLLSEPY